MFMLEQRQPNFIKEKLFLWIVFLLARLVRNWKQALLIGQPDTLLRWHRQLFRLVWKHKSQAASHTPKVAPETVALIGEMAVQNRLWGAERIRGELHSESMRNQAGRLPPAWNGLKRLEWLHPFAAYWFDLDLFWHTVEQRNGLGDKWPHFRLSHRLCMAVFICPQVFHPDDLWVFDIFVDQVEQTSRIGVEGFPSFQEDLHDLVPLPRLCS